MPKRTDLQSILIIGAGPIIIGQACEFDYSGAQACKALREEGYRVDPGQLQPRDHHDRSGDGGRDLHRAGQLAHDVARIIEKERPDALLPTMGGQTALNTALDLVREGVLEKYGVELIAASRAAIDMAEDRELFRNAMREIGLGDPAVADRPQPGGGAGDRRRDRLPGRHPPLLHPGRQRRRHRLQPRGARGRSWRAASMPRPPGRCCSRSR